MGVVNETDIAASSYREHPAPPELRHVLACTWHQRIAPGRGPYQQRVLPDGHADLVVDDRGRALLVGPATRVELPELPAGGAVHGLRLAFHAVGPLLRVPAAELTDRVVPLSAVVSEPLATAVCDALGDGDPAATALTQRWLAGAAPDRRVGAAVRALWRRPGLEIVSVADRVGLSSRQLRRALLAEVGLGPKMFQRVGRLQRFLALAGSDPGRGLAELAAEAGYADQPHLSREAKTLAGLTATELLAYQLG